jgi:hypothetical protein
MSHDHSRSVPKPTCVPDNGRSPHFSTIISLRHDWCSGGWTRGPQPIAATCLEPSDLAFKSIMVHIGLNLPTLWDSCQIHDNEQHAHSDDCWNLPSSSGKDHQMRLYFTTAPFVSATNVPRTHNIQITLYILQPLPRKFAASYHGHLPRLGISDSNGWIGSNPAKILCR